MKILVSKEATKLLIAASGTGGHVFPAIAVAEKLSGYKIEWLGVPDRLESKLVPKEYPLHLIRVGGFQGKPGLGTLKTIGGLIKGIFQVRKLLKQGKFDAVFSTGGYISAPAILAGYSLGLPVLLHESNALPGKVTRSLSPFCTKVAVGFVETSKYLPRAKTIYLGTPCRQQFLTPEPLDLPISKDSPLIVVVGGSQGAVALNQMIRECVGTWLDAGVTIVHIVGGANDPTEKIEHPQYIVLPFYDNMAGLFQRADLAISRAGAATLNELMITRTPSILVPYPYAAEDHQYYNANVLAGANAALLFRQESLTAQFLATEVLNLLENPQRRESMASNASSLGVINSADLLADLIGESVNTRLRSMQPIHSQKGAEG
ncbi:undecaprenyldiphospho-muramoylpentapeptide beta-N-acetylglucosaminyltransferase [Chamaesiphon sp. OTE_75_metabat_556]|uniref:undecaprenyldiphospho-muramoylpentapeptide beta-N-acetylglucosaminyltransferase n=1 Tax=Chamaesiphon sp. OTE_75_metabat_556 TaxID=2964692 RepID=UPI00286B9C63|nr:undecaprenyldiphospho-muramoylpentapeptide beta-N-acetylglucosaminyltransferase [Chamaesiphon sp. OTE_75_metabat_556]